MNSEFLEELASLGFVNKHETSLARPNTTWLLAIVVPRSALEASPVHLTGIKSRWPSRDRSHLRTTERRQGLHTQSIRQRRADSQNIWSLVTLLSDTSLDGHCKRNETLKSFVALVFLLHLKAPSLIWYYFSFLDVPEFHMEVCYLLLVT